MIGVLTMNGIEFMQKILAEYPEEKPVAFNYAQARQLLIALAGRVVNLEARFPENGAKEEAA
jgi:hypothetical protein